MHKKFLQIFYYFSGILIFFSLQGCITTESFGSGRGAGAKHKGTFRHEHKVSVNQYQVAAVQGEPIIGEVYEPIVVSSEITESIILPETESYIVQKGDILSQIAIDFDTTTATLIELNGITNPDQLSVGQMLQVPINLKVKSSLKTKKISSNIKKGGTYKIQSGDTLSEIAVAAGVSISDIRALNNINGDRIFAGQEIDIPDYGNVPQIDISSENEINIPIIAELASSEENINLIDQEDNDSSNNLLSSITEVIILPGETLDDIARENGVSKSKIREINPSLDNLPDDNLESLIQTKLRIPREF
ncbi:MAG: LysM peptidoglycan-binding domain-containing protein [Pontiellaceae bacterium]